MGIEQYEHPYLTVDGVILTSDIHIPDKDFKDGDRAIQVLLMKRTDEPFKDKWVLPGGFVDIDKTLEDALYEKVFTKANINSAYFEQLYTYGNLGRDPRGRVVTTTYLVLGGKDKLDSMIKRGISGIELSWFWVQHSHEGQLRLIKADESSVEECSGDDLGFDHGEILADALCRIRSKVLNSDIALLTLPEEFTIRECQQVFEQLAGQEISNFRRLINPKIEETGNILTGRAHRPATLFKIKGET